ncbi:hypothetical protein [Aeromonas caviae]|uniref:hypothetical protein n=1 Tax=Aeromonas caviae TaxID=648 RepID=UPI002B4786FA|nr:hypothetical protein [Aeromonas caviae]
MSNDETAPPVQQSGFGFSTAQKAPLEQVARPNQWSPGLRALSAEEYERFTEQLAQELLAAYTPDHISVIAAQHMIWADELECLLEEERTRLECQLKVEKTRLDCTREALIESDLIMHRSYRAQLAKKRADAVRNGKRDVQSLAQSIAAEKWRDDTCQKIKIGKMAEAVYLDLLNTEHSKLVSGPSCVRNWIRPVAPPYASKPGKQY